MLTFKVAISLVYNLHIVQDKDFSESKNAELFSKENNSGTKATRIHVWLDINISRQQL